MKTIQEIEDELLQDLSNKLERNKILTNEVDHFFRLVLLLVRLIC